MQSYWALLVASLALTRYVEDAPTARSNQHVVRALGDSFAVVARGARELSSHVLAGDPLGPRLVAIPRRPSGPAWIPQR